MEITMSEFIIYGVPGSPFVRSVCLGLEEKGAPYRIQGFGAGEMRSEAHLKLHPFGRVPAIDHGGYKLSETAEILGHIGPGLPGPRLKPTPPKAIDRLHTI